MVSLEADYKIPPTVIPAEAEIQLHYNTDWMPASAGMTTRRLRVQ